MSQIYLEEMKSGLLKKNERNASNIYSLDKFSESMIKLDKAYLKEDKALPIFAEIGKKGVKNNAFA